MASANLNYSPQQDTPYSSPQQQILTNTADEQHVVAGPGGGGATETVPRDQLIPTTHGGLEKPTPHSAPRDFTDQSRLDVSVGVGAGANIEAPVLEPPKPPPEKPTSSSIIPVLIPRGPGAGG